MWCHEYQTRWSGSVSTVKRCYLAQSYCLWWDRNQFRLSLWMYWFHNDDESRNPHISWLVRPEHTHYSTNDQSAFAPHKTLVRCIHHHGRMCVCVCVTIASWLSFMFSTFQLNTCQELYLGSVVLLQRFRIKIGQLEEWRVNYCFPISLNHCRAQSCGEDAGRVYCAPTFSC